MSGHFAGTHDTSASSSASKSASTSSASTATTQEVVSKGTYWQRFKRTAKDVLSFYPDPSNPQHKRLIGQAKLRAGIVFCCFIYVGYHHPEYSILSAWYHGSDKPLAEQRWEQMSGGQSPGSPRQQEQVESIMSRSTRSIYRKKDDK